MITTDEDVKMEDQILMLYSSQSLVSLLFKFCHAFHAFICLYTLIAVIILRYSSHRYWRQYRYCHLQLCDALTTSGLGPKLAIRHWFMVQCVSAMHVPLVLAYLATQRNA